jgi:hypothetical protein
LDRIPFTLYDFFAYLASGIVVLAVADLTLGTNILLRESIPPLLAVLLVCFAYVAGHVVAQLSSVFLEALFVRRFLHSPEDHLLGVEAKSAWSFLFPGHFRPLPAVTIGRIRKRAEIEAIAPTGRAFFFHCHEYAKGESVTRARLDIFLALYGFSRNLSMAFLLSTALFLSALVHPALSMRTTINTPATLAALSFLLAAIMFYRYLKFFRSFTQEVLLSYSEVRKGGKEDAHRDP